MRRFLAVLGAAAVLAAGCGDDGDEGAAGEATSTTAEAGGGAGEGSAGGDGEAPALYPDHVSEQYAGTGNWICHPDLPDDECRDLRTTVIAPDGSRTVEEAEPAADPAFDCFYVYPTTSTDPGPNADLDVDESEIDTVRAQVARYASVCRVFAPAYRQIVLSAIGGGATGDHWTVAYGDVVDAWRSYVTDHNDGRGVVLIGHSQGASHLSRLLEEEIAPSAAARELLVSAVLLGWPVPVEGIGGIPPCASADEAGCIVSYASFPADQPPAEGTLFGRTRGDEPAPAMCVDPAELVGRAGEPVEAILPTKLSLLGGVQGFQDVETPFVSLPAAVRVSCEEANGYGFLAVALAGAEGDVRPLDGLVEQRLGPTWGLHLLDANLGQDELIELVARQAAAR